MPSSSIGRALGSERGDLQQLIAYYFYTVHDKKNYVCNSLLINIVVSKHRLTSNKVQNLAMN